MKIRYASLCSGISCESVAWMPLGWEPQFFAEIDPFACAVLKHHYPNVPNLGDIRNIDGREWRGKVDVLIAGTPCQSYSLAGKRGMLNDPRGNLALEYGRIINEAKIPVSIFENVPGVLAGDVSVFQAILSGIIGAKEIPKRFLPQGRWPGAGLVAGPARWAAFRELDCQYFSLAQRRLRLYVVSVDIGSRIHPFPLLLECESLPGNPPPGAEAGAKISRTIASSTGGASGKQNQLTLISGDNKPLDALRPGTGTLCMAHGQGGAEIGVDQCPTLTCNHEAPIAFSAKDHGADAGDIAPTLRAMEHCRSHANGGGQVAIAYPLQEIGRRPTQNGSGVGDANAPMFTLQASSQHGMAHTLRGEGHDASEDGTGRGTPLTVSLRGREGGNTAELGDNISNALRTGGGGSDKPHVLTEMAIRRLTVRETERLMGLEDDYTLIPYGNGGHRKKDLDEMAAYWGVTPEVAATLAADSHRYRAVGNGMAVPVVRWLGERIEMAMKLVGYVPVAERD